MTKDIPNAGLSNVLTTPLPLSIPSLPSALEDLRVRFTYCAPKSAFWSPKPHQKSIGAPLRDRFTPDWKRVYERNSL